MATTPKISFRKYKYFKHDQEAAIKSYLKNTKKYINIFVETALISTAQLSFLFSLQFFEHFSKNTNVFQT